VGLADLSIRRPVLAWMAMAALVLFGGLSFGRLGISQYPDVEFPVVTVALTMPGAGPAVMEASVVDPIEQALATVESVREVASDVFTGYATIAIQFDLERDVDLALEDVQVKIAQVQRLLPRELEPPVLAKWNPDSEPVLWICLSGFRAEADMVDYASYTLRPRLQALPGVAAVDLQDLRSPSVRVWFDRDALDREGLTVSDAVGGIGREHAEAPAGAIETSTWTRDVRFEGEAATDAALGDLVLGKRGEDAVRLKDVATVELGLEDRRSAVRLNGLPAVEVGVRKSRGSNAVAVARAVRAEVAKLRATLPAGLSIDIVGDQTSFVAESIDEIELAIALAVALTGLVCWGFLGSWGAALNVLLAIPTSLVGALTALYALGFTLNTFTLLALSLAVGIVVDDAIMVLENIVRHREMGADRAAAASRGAGEITAAAVAATIAIIAIFLPVAFMRGAVARHFYQFGVTLAIAVAISLLEALTLTPMRCARFMGRPGHASAAGRAIERGFDGLKTGYRRALAGALRRPILVLLASTALFCASLGLAGRIGKELVPAQDSGEILVRVRTPPGASLEHAEAVVRRCEEVFAAHEEIVQVFAVVVPDTISKIIVRLTPRAERATSLQALVRTLRGELASVPDVHVAAVRENAPDLFGGGTTSSTPVSCTIRGPDFDVLAEKQEALCERMRASGLFADVDSNYRLGLPEVRIVPDRGRAADLGVPMEAIAATAQALIGGARVGTFASGGHRYEIRAQLARPQRLRPEDIGRLRVRAVGGTLVDLDQVARIEAHPALQKISRRDRERAVWIGASPAPGVPQDRAIRGLEAIAAGVLPEGYRIVFQEGAQTFEETFRSLAFALVLGMVIAYMVLAAQFESYLHPVTVLLALPFSATGALAALYLFGHTINVFSGIGLILLMGIAKKNSIMLVEYTKQRREADRLAPREALLEACPARLRPVLMTSIATVVAALPAALLSGPGFELRAPMAVAVVGGVVVSTAMTLFVVPCFYLAAERARARLRATPRPAPPVPAAAPVEAGAGGSP
jgi:hydrophobe/amphiphile efflux-1 (HAE1) family protein